MFLPKADFANAIGIGIWKFFEIVENASVSEWVLGGRTIRIDKFRAIEFPASITNTSFLKIEMQVVSKHISGPGSAFDQSFGDHSAGIKRGGRPGRMDLP